MRVMDSGNVFRTVLFVSKQSSSLRSKSLYCLHVTKTRYISLVFFFKNTKPQQNYSVCTIDKEKDFVGKRKFMSKHYKRVTQKKNYLK